MTESTLTPEEIDRKMELQRLSGELGAFTDELRAKSGVDQRWLSIAVTDLQKGMMELRRAVYPREGF